MKNPITRLGGRFVRPARFNGDKQSATRVAAFVTAALLTGALASGTAKAQPSTTQKEQSVRVELCVLPDYLKKMRGQWVCVNVIEPEVPSGPSNPPIISIPRASRQGASDIYFTSNDAFKAKKAQRANDGPITAWLRVYDWGSNGCAGQDFSHNLSDMFRDACDQLDFAYRNFGRGLKLDNSDAQKSRIDEHFYNLLLQRCNKDLGRWTQLIALGRCKLEALWMYADMKQGGWNS